jgi:hypothetical protein
MASWMEMAIWHPPVSVFFLHVACEWDVLIYGEVDYGSVCSGVLTLIFSWGSYCHLGGG